MKETIKKFIVQHFLYGQSKLKENESLFESGIIDSMGILELIAFIEKEFAVSFSPSDITIDNFDSIDKIIGLIEKRKNKTSR